MVWHVIYEGLEEDWSQCTALWHSECDSWFPRLFIIYYNSLGPILHGAFNPVQVGAFYAIVLEFLKETLEWDHIKSFAEVYDG